MSVRQSLSTRTGRLLGASGLIIIAVGMAIVATPKLTSTVGNVDRQAASPAAGIPSAPGADCIRVPPSMNEFGLDWGVAVGQLALVPTAGSMWHGVDPFGQHMPIQHYAELEAQLEGTVEVDKRSGTFTLPTYGGEWTHFPVNMTTTNCLTWMLNTSGAFDTVLGAFPGEVVFVAGDATSPIVTNSVNEGARVVDFGAYVGEGVTAIHLPQNWIYRTGESDGPLIGELRLLSASAKVPEQFILAGGQPVSDQSTLGKRLVLSGARPHGGAVLVPNLPAPAGYRWVIASNGWWANPKETK